MKQFQITSLVLLFSLLGCASRKEIVQFKQDTQYLRWQSESLKEENKELLKKLETLMEKLTIIQDESIRTKADLFAELTELKNQIEFLNGKLEDNTYRMTGFIQKVEGKYTKVTKSDSISYDNEVSKTETTIVDENDLNPRVVYNSAYMDLSRNNYQLAIQGFSEYLARFPNSDLADNAQYWLGECYYAQRDFLQAIDEFDKVVTKYPSGDKIDGALLKIGFSYINIGDEQNAKKYLTVVIERFPDSDEAKMARTRLAVIK